MEKVKKIIDFKGKAPFQFAPQPYFFAGLIVVFCFNLFIAQANIVNGQPNSTEDKAPKTNLKKEKRKIVQQGERGTTANTDFASPQAFQPKEPSLQMSGHESKELATIKASLPNTAHGKKSKSLQLVELIEPPIHILDTEDKGNRLSPIANKFSDSYIAVAVNEPKGQKLRSQYDVHTFPTLLILAENGAELTRVTGKITPAELEWALKTVTQPGNTIPELKKLYFAQLLGAEGLETYLKLLDLASEPATEVAMCYLRTAGPTNWTGTKAWKVINERIFDWSSEPILFLMHNHKAYRKLYGDAAVDNKLTAVCMQALLVAAKNGAPQQTFDELQEELMAIGYEGMPAIIAQAQVQRFKLIADWHAYAEATQFYFTQYGGKDAAELATEARCLLINLQKANHPKANKWALKWAEEAVKLTTVNTAEKAIYLETLSMALAVNGKSDLAWSTADQALQLANKHNLTLPEASYLIEALKSH